MAEEL
ncbi:hypothetical protein CGLO_15102 [Colletotrichum gloeosporioides Cg-14]|jgi:hypothetical protein